MEAISSVSPLVKPLTRALTLVLHRHPAAPAHAEVTGLAGPRPFTITHDSAAQTVSVAFTHPVAESTQIELRFS